LPIVGAPWNDRDDELGRALLLERANGIFDAAAVGFGK
jgi:hypothetical protein